MSMIDNCEDIADCMCDYHENLLGPAERAAFERHLESCNDCRERLTRHRGVQSLLNLAVGSNRLSANFAATTGKKLAAVAAELTAPESAALEPAAEEDLQRRLGAAPWWFVSLCLHVLTILLASLVSMAIELPRSDDGNIMITELQQSAQIKQEQDSPKATESALESKLDTPPTDPASKEASDIVVPPDILAKAELGDHFETINPDRADTHSAYGNEDARSFHLVDGSADKPGGGGANGLGIEDVIGVGGASLRGSGGGFGGGDGGGMGVQSGAGKGSFGNRNGGGRRLMVKRHGGSKATENAVDLALHWLAYHQEADGHWDIKKYEGGNMESGGQAFDEGVSAIATLAFLGAGHTTRLGNYKDNVQRAVAWIISKQQPDGRFSSKRHLDFDQYDLAICTLALCEADGMVGGHDPKIHDAAQKGIDAIVRCQEAHGAWNHSGGGEGSTSLFGWMVMALKSGKIAGLKVPASAFENALKRMEAVSEKDAAGYWGAVGYTSRGFWPIGKLTMTAVGMVALQFMGLGSETTEQANMLVKNLPKWRVGPQASWGTPIEDPQNFYHWYYSTLGMFQTGGQQWKDWNEALKKTLLPMQQKAGDAAGSWDPVTTFDSLGGRVYTSAMGALCMEVYYRYALLSRDK